VRKKKKKKKNKSMEVASFSSEVLLKRRTYGA